MCTGRPVPSAGDLARARRPLQGVFATHDGVFAEPMMMPRLYAVYVNVNIVGVRAPRPGRWPLRAGLGGPAVRLALFRRLLRSGAKALHL